MTARIENAIRKLLPEELEKLADFAERLLQERRSCEAGKDTSKHVSLSWEGMGGDLYPEYKSGVDAAHAATEMRRDAIRRKLSKAAWDAFDQMP